MLRKIIIGAVLLVLILAIVACAGPAPSPTPPPVPKPTPSPTPPPAPKPSGLIKAKWIESQVSGDTVSIPINAVENNWNVLFEITKQGSNLTFMAYTLDGEIFVRASTCPPCRGISYSLNGDILDCDTCGTTFEAKTGAGIEGPCVNYPKASVAYQIIDGNIVMDEADLVRAYQDTIERG